MINTQTEYICGNSEKIKRTCHSDREVYICFSLNHIFAKWKVREFVINEGLRVRFFFEKRNNPTATMVRKFYLNLSIVDGFFFRYNDFKDGALFLVSGASRNIIVHWRRACWMKNVEKIVSSQMFRAKWSTLKCSIVWELYEFLIVRKNMIEVTCPFSVEYWKFL